MDKQLFCFLTLSAWITTASSDGLKKKSEKVIMISYNWSDSSDLADKIYEKLTDLQFNVWIDKKKMFGNKYDTMSKAVDMCSIFLMFVSPNYAKSKDCKIEAQLAADNGKKVIPVRTVKGYHPPSNEWIACMEVGKMYYDFAGASFDEAFEKLLRAINHALETLK